ncbi:hypothetical protein J7E61_01260 [Pseudomonas fluorescens]|uniref:Uncharacterized protein n=1 Tax=Pseudomonas fluorescens TaxID=294 RepID=A0A944DP59_PSEFL|nr:hypothetical protein [Pseudomonas fluorescens]MBT2306132.1 hypothetical protein [Pseudomonas fluorescens]MBT2314511.1 hypothetical protein [Pseudomonas fluorescens]MBT2315740.1 hypothetical protein [Pseudomonas fluorescens]MBT2330345.1 hypothetical protein [Pseudomonas fluorescens]
MNDFNDWKTRAAQLRLKNNALIDGLPREAGTLGRMIMVSALVASHADINELVDKTRIAVDRTARAYGRL